MTGLTSRTGVPSTASSPRTVRMRELTETSRATVAVVERHGIKHTGFYDGPSHQTLAESVGAVLPALRQHPHQRPGRVVSRMARRPHDLLVAHAIEEEDDLDVREGVEPHEAVGGNVVGELHVGDDRIPVVVDRLAARVPDPRQRLHGEGGHRQRPEIGYLGSPAQCAQRQSARSSSVRSTVSC